MDSINQYCKTIDEVNGCYRIILEIEKVEHYFPDLKKKVNTMLTAKTKEECRKAQQNPRQNCTEYKKTNKGYLKNLRVQIELLPNPSEYLNQPNKKRPTLSQTKTKEQLLNMEQYMAFLDM